VFRQAGVCKILNKISELLCKRKVTFVCAFFAAAATSFAAAAASFATYYVTKLEWYCVAAPRTASSVCCV
jgi:hypothetical protein